MTTETRPEEMTGMQQLQRAFFDAPASVGIGRTMDFRAVELEVGRVVFEGSPDERFYNPIGTVHGGYAATMLDSVTGCAVHSRLAAGQGYTTLELKVAYHRALTRDSGPVRAEGTVVQMGRRAAFAEARLTDREGRLCASATSTLLVFDRPVAGVAAS